MRKTVICVVLVWCAFVMVFPAAGACASAPADEAVGEFAGFGATVSAGNYYVARGAISVFGTKWGPQPQTPEELEERVWEDLLLSYEAFRRNITVNDEELGEEIDKILSSEKVELDRVKDPVAYEAWLKEKTNEPRQLFENQLRHLIQLEKLRKAVMDGITPAVSEEEAHQEFLDEYNTLSVEMAQFDDRRSADAFYRRMKKKPALWERETKENPKLFRRPGFVALEFLMEMWRFPRGDAYAMLSRAIGSLYPPIPIYGGKFGVCRILQIRPAVQSEFARLKDSYYEQVRMKKRVQGLNDWIARLKDEAKIKVFKKVTVVQPAEGQAAQAP